MINFKNFYKRLIFDADSVIVEKYIVTQNDTKSRGFYVEIYQNGEIVSASEGSLLTFYGKKPDGKTVFEEAAVENGLYRIDLKNQTFNIPGEIKSELTLRGPNGEILTKKVIIQVTPSFVDSDPIESHDDFSALQQALAKVAEFAGEIEDLRLLSENIVSDLGDIDSLTTINKENLVNSINELNLKLENKIDEAHLASFLESYALSSEIGNLESLETVNKDNLVDALNETMTAIKNLELNNDNDYLVDLILQKADKKDVGNIKDLHQFVDGTKPNNLTHAVNYLFESNVVILEELSKVNTDSFAKYSDVGNIQNLITEDKTSIVNSINEIGRKMEDVESITNAEELSLLIKNKADKKDLGDKGDLSTTHKGNIVEAVNEVYYKIENVELQPGPQGEPGQPGKQGPPGKDGSDASVTKDKIISELGFTPVSESVIGDINSILDEINGEKE